MQKARKAALQNRKRQKRQVSEMTDTARPETATGTAGQTGAPIDDPAALTRHIETRYHARHREQLPELLALSTRVEHVHQSAKDAPLGLSAILQKLIGEMEVHMKKEELLVFPAIRQGGRAGLGETIAQMRADHDDQEQEIAEITSVTHGLALPQGACRKWTALYQGLGEFIEDLREHTRLENEILFPQFEEQG